MVEVATHKGQEFDFESLLNHTERVTGKNPAFIKSIRESAAVSFNNIGLPEKRDEMYKYLSVHDLFDPNYVYQYSQEIKHFDINHVFQCDIPAFNTHLIILVNGFYYGGTGKLNHLPGGLRYGSLMTAAEEMPEVFEQHYSKVAGIGSDSLVDLNTSLARDGFFIFVPKNAVVEKPIQVVNLILAGKELFLQPRNFVVLEENAQLNMVICDHALSKKKSFTNSVTETFVSNNANLDFTLLHNKHNDASLINYHYIKQERDSRVVTNSISLHGGVIRNNLNVLLDGEGAENHSNGLYLADKDQVIDNFVVVDHARANCHSEQLFKGVLDDRAKGTFSGRILVRKDSQNTAAYQRNNNILLTDLARMNSKPQLEIYADDVKCSHGATVGQIDEEAMFYLRTRGISLHEARLMMMYGFTHEVINKIHIESLRDRIADLVYKRLKGELAKCDNCSVLNS
ncbi:MAG: Fe-S cluster assembly protein SufD [Bacteroidales bacterium]|nr:Fe-S cluster assembly protein SufD [Bacteroidales bacterium]